PYTTLFRSANYGGITRSSVTIGSGGRYRLGLHQLLAQLNEPLPAKMGLSQTHMEKATHGSYDIGSPASVSEIVPGIYSSVSHAGGVEARPSGAESKKTQVP